MRACEYKLKVTFKTFVDDTVMTVPFEHISPEKVLEYAELFDQSVNCTKVEIKPMYEVEA